MVKDFEDYNVSNLVDVLSIVDNLFITLTIAKLQDISSKMDSLRENNFHLFSFKHFVESNGRSDSARF